MSPAQFFAMVTQDMKAVKDFLWDRNNAGELNHRQALRRGRRDGRLGGFELRLADAVEQDNNRVPRAEYKLGRFVKALVLISPERSFRACR